MSDPYAVRDQIAKEIAENAEREALMNADERLELARQRRNRMIRAASGVPAVPGYTLREASVHIEIGNEVVDIDLSRENKDTQR